MGARVWWWSSRAPFAFLSTAASPNLPKNSKPLIMADTFTGEPGFSAPVYEADFAPVKPRCDVLLVGSAHAPKGEPTTKVPVGLKVGSLVKSFNVLGDRVWESSGVLVSPSRPKPFLAMPLSYDRAFGGQDNFHFDPKEHSAYMPNPVGKGYRRHLIEIDGTPVPTTRKSTGPLPRPKAITGRCPSG